MLTFDFSHARQLMEDTIRRNASPVRPEQSEGMRDHHEALGGSSSSLNSSASDDSVRVSQGGMALKSRVKIIQGLFPKYSLICWPLLSGARRSTLLHSFSTNDANLGEYKYTVSVGGCLLKITGSNHDLVRVREPEL